MANQTNLILNAFSKLMWWAGLDPLLGRCDTPGLDSYYIGYRSIHWDFLDADKQPN